MDSSCGLYAAASLESVLHVLRDCLCCGSLESVLHVLRDCRSMLWQSGVCFTCFKRLSMLWQSSLTTKAETTIFSLPIC
jgi:hypothetical protein